MIAEGPAIVLLHGMLGAPGPLARWWAGEGAAADVHAPWLPGHGPEPWGTELGSFDEAVSALAERLPRRPLAIIGYSLGGRVALALAARQDPRVVAAIAIGASTGIASDEERRDRARWDASMAALARSGGMAALVDAWEKLPLFASQRALDPSLLSAQRRARLAHRAEAIAWAFETLGAAAMPDVAPRLEASPAPIAFVSGALDEKYAALAKAMGERLHAPARLVSGAGHNPIVEAPQAARDSIRELLGSLVSPSHAPRGTS